MRSWWGARKECWRRQNTLPTPGACRSRALKSQLKPARGPQSAHAPPPGRVLPTAPSQASWRAGHSHDQLPPPLPECNNHYGGGKGHQRRHSNGHSKHAAIPLVLGPRTETSSRTTPGRVLPLRRHVGGTSSSALPIGAPQMSRPCSSPPAAVQSCHAW